MITLRLRSLMDFSSCAWLALRSRMPPTYLDKVELVLILCVCQWGNTRRVSSTHLGIERRRDRDQALEDGQHFAVGRVCGTVSDAPPNASVGTDTLGSGSLVCGSARCRWPLVAGATNHSRHRPRRCCQPRDTRAARNLRPTLREQCSQSLPQYATCPRGHRAQCTLRSVSSRDQE